MQDILDNRKGGRRQSDTSTDGLPWQLKAVGVIGVPSAIAIYLVYSLINGIIPALVNGNALLSSHMSQMGLFVADQTTIKMQNEDILKVLRISCTNQAKTDSDRDRCLR